jgi:Ran GTPase-activating protein (RanGAP) involved in mRNA processing and transport
MAVEEILYILQQNVTSMLCGRALNQVNARGRGCIDDTEVALLARALCINTSLTVLDLSENMLSVQGAKVLVDALRMRPKLRTLHLSFLELGGADSGFLAEALVRHTSLTSLDLSGVSGSARPCQDELLSVVRANTSLRLLRLKPSDTLRLQALAETLQHLPKLVLLDFSRCELNGSAVTAIAEYVKVSQVLHSLNLAYSLDKVGAKKNELLDALRYNSSLSTIMLHANLTGGFDGQLLSHVLRKNTALTSLDIYGNYLTVTGVLSIAAALKGNTSLRSIGLGHACLHLRGIQALAEALMVNTTLTSIDLNDNTITASGAQALALALHVNTSLVSINLSSNQINSISAQVLAKALLVNNSLRSLNLCLNNISGIGVRGVMTELKENTSLTELNVYTTWLEKQILEATVDMLRDNTSMMSVYMPDHYRRNFQKSMPVVESDAHEILKNALQTNSSLISFTDCYGVPIRRQIINKNFGLGISNILVRNKRRLFFIRSPHGLKNLILYSLFSKPLSRGLLQSGQLPHLIQFQLTQCATALCVLDKDILARAIMAGWCCGCGSFEDVEASSLEEPDYACSFSGSR